MSRALGVLALSIGTLLPGGAAAEVARVAPRPLASALEAAAAGRWEVAARLAARDGPAAADLIEWQRLRAGLGRVSEVLAFLDRNAHWPGLDLLRRQSEVEFARASFDDVLRFYDGHPPQTGAGVLTRARAQLARGQVGEAEASVVMAWRSMPLGTADHDGFLHAHGDLLAPHHAARLDMLLWRGWAGVEAMLPLVPDDLRARAVLRRRIAAGGAIPDDLSPAQRGDPGIAHALFERAIRDDPDRAIAIILRQSRLRDGLGRPAAWAGWRRYLVRSRMRAETAQLAYDLASVHQLVEGAAYADLEWMSGYLALRYLDAPELALDHFQRFRAAVGTPISLGRAGYWLGRAQQALGDAGAAQLAYAQGAAHQTSFYGLLAAERAGLPLDPALSGPASAAAVPPGGAPGFAHGDLHEIAMLALAMGDTGLARQFLERLSDRLDRAGLVQLARVLAARDAAHLQVILGKRAVARGLVVPALYYPLHPLAEMDLPVPAELALAIARQESEFRPDAASSAGALGLMQVLPATARHVAGALGLPYDGARLTGDWAYNARLGAAYLARLGTRFVGNVPLASAGYNAGPGRPLDWIERLGDPRLPETLPRGWDVVDWIEHIPFRETRNYVMRVAEGVVVYRARLGKPALPVPFSAELSGSSFAAMGE